MTYAAKNIPASKVRELIERYKTEELHPRTAHLEISSLMLATEGVPESQGRAGVYAIYRADETLIYFGMSLNNVAARVSKHVSKRVQASSFWTTNVAEFVQTILVANRWQAPSLEEFLIQRAQAH
jgi:hypothetical protein